MSDPPTVDVKLTGYQLATVVKAFTCMHANFDNPEVFDKEMVQLSRADLQDILGKLSAASDQGDVVVPMAFSDWVHYSGFLSIADEDLSEIDGDELEILRELSEICGELAESGRAPSGSP